MQLCNNKMEMTQIEIDTNYGVINFLLENGADRKLQTFKGKTAYDLTKKHINKYKIRELLINAK